MRESGRPSLALLLLDSLVILGLLLLVVAGAGLYRSAVDAQRLHAQQRSALSYVQSQAAYCRTGVAVEPGAQGDILLLTQPDGDYVTCIYLYEQTLRSQLVPAGTRLQPEQGDVICPMEVFRLSWLDSGLLEVQTDSGSAYISSRGGGANG